MRCRKKTAVLWDICALGITSEARFGPGSWKVIWRISVERQLGSASYDGIIPQFDVNLYKSLNG